MNGAQARSLRRSIGFVPGAPRQYKSDNPRHKVTNVNGVGQIVTINGTIHSTGARQQYQKAKRAGLARILVGGA